jgi:hypothetical protein
MAISTIDGTIEEVVIKRRRSQGSVYERIKFRLDDGSVRTSSNSQVLNHVGDLLLPGTRGRFYLFKTLDQRGVSGVRTDEGKEAFGVTKLNETVSLWIAIINLLLTVFYATVFDDVSFLPRFIAAFLAVAGVPMYFYYRQNRLDAEKAFRADAGFRPAARAT